jgi:serine/threonine-protein kinase PknG
MAATSAAPDAPSAPTAGAPLGGGASTPTRSSNRLGSAPIGSARGSTSSRPTKRLGGGAQSSRLGAGFTQVPSIPEADPRDQLMNPPVVEESKRFCAVCNTPVGRSRGDQPGRTKGFCPKCRTPFDFEPKLTAGALVGGQYEVVGGLAHGGMGWIYLARDRNVNDRWVVLKGLLNAGDPDATRAAIAEKQYLAEVEHPLIVEIYNFVTSADGASYIVMEYVGGRSLNNLLKDRMKVNGGQFSPIPVDQAIAYIVEILPAFTYLHTLGLLYCDFKPANIIQVQDSLKLIDLGGVRRLDDDTSPIYGTVGFQAPEVAADGCTVASDVYTVARTLAVLVFEFKGYQSKFERSLPTPDDVSLFAEHDSLYRWLLKGTALKPEDRFQSAEEMRDQLFGVLRDVTARVSTRAVTRSTPSRLFDTPAVADDHLDWHDLPALAADQNDPQAAWLSAVTADDPRARLEALAQAPEESTGVLLARGMASLAAGDGAAADTVAEQVLGRDPWEWRGVWLHGLAAHARGDARNAVAFYNSVYGQVPGELAPKLALARACELSGEHDVAERMYALCARSDAAYVAPAQFGRARIAAAAGRRDDALAALDQIPPTSRAYGDARRQRAMLLAAAIDPAHAVDDLGAAADELQRATLDPPARSGLRIQILDSALDHVRAHGAVPGRTIDGAAVAETPLRLRLEAAYREAAKLATTPAERAALVDRANAVRPTTLV